VKYLVDVKDIKQAFANHLHEIEPHIASGIPEGGKSAGRSLQWDLFWKRLNGRIHLVVEEKKA